MKYLVFEAQLMHSYSSEGYSHKYLGIEAEGINVADTKEIAMEFAKAARENQVIIDVELEEDMINRSVHSYYIFIQPVAEL